MAETSTGRVTITLGRSGQVVKRDGSVSNISYNDSVPTVGSKRSVRDRLGSNADSSVLGGNQLNHKRQRGDIGMTNGIDDVRIGKDDLRYKLMQKNVVRRAPIDDHQNNMDLREKLSKIRPPGSGSYTRQSMLEPKDSGILRRAPPTRSADDLRQIDSFRNSYSSWTMDNLRRRSPDGIVGTSRGPTPSRNVEELQRRPSIRPPDDVRSAPSVPYMSKDVHDPSRSVSSATFMTKPTLPAGSAKAVPPLLAQLPQLSGIVRKGSYTGDEQHTVDSLLHSLGLEKYVVLFKAEEVDMTALKQMGENDLKEIGIPMGPRKKILLALLSRAKRQL